MSQERLCCCADSPLRFPNELPIASLWFASPWGQCCVLRGNLVARPSVCALRPPFSLRCSSPQGRCWSGGCGQTLPLALKLNLQLPPVEAEEWADPFVISQMKWEVLKSHAKIENNGSGMEPFRWDGAFSVRWLSSYIRGLARNSFSPSPFL